MKKLMTTLMLSLMCFGFFNVAVPTVAQAETTTIPGFDVTYGEGGVNVESETDSSNAIGTIFNKFKKFILAFSGIGAIFMIGAFIMQFLKLGASAGNPQGRSQAITGILWSGVATALLGSVTLITGIFYNSF